MLLAKPSLRYAFNELDIANIDTSHLPDLYTFLHSLALGDTVIWVGEEAVYADELRADYTHKALYLPVFRQDIITENDVQYSYNNRVEKIILHSADSGWIQSNIVVQPSALSKYAYKVDIKRLRFMRELTEKDKEAKDLFLRYLVSSYSYTSFESDYKKYKRISRGYINKAHKNILKSHELDFYGDYVELDYRGVRDWKLEDLIKHYDADTLHLEESKGARRVYFELELYNRLISNQLWTGWTDGNLEELLSNNREYLKYKENGIYLIFKGNWLK